MIMMDKLRVAAYCRVSTDKEDQINSLNSQRKYFTEFINKNQSWDLVDIYYDEGVSGTSTKKRIGFNSMIADANARKIDLILTKEISRFARNTLDSLSYTRELKNIGVGVIFINDNINTLDADSELRLTIMSSIAQEESRKTSERVKWGQRRRMEQGVVFGRDMLGYYVTNGELIINHEEKDVVKLIYHKFLNEGKGTHVIARELYEAGIKPKRVKQWSNTVILRVLKNEKYVGDLLQKKTYTPDYLSHTKKYNRNNEDTIFIKNHHEPIIDRYTWDKVQKELARRAPSNEERTKYSSRYWCSGKIVCGKCGQRFSSRTKQLKNGTQYNAWRCYSAITNGTKKQNKTEFNTVCSSSINNKTLLTCTQYAAKHVQTNRDKIVADLVKDIRAVLSSTCITDTTKLYSIIEEISNKKKKAINLSIEGAISTEDLILMNKQYNSEIEQVRKKIDDTENINNIQLKQADCINSHISEIRSMVNMETTDDALYREILEKIIIYNGDCLTVYLKHVPCCIKLHFHTIGKLESYKTNIDDIEIYDIQ